MKTFINYSSIISYVGNLDPVSFSAAIKLVVDNLPNYVLVLRKTVDQYEVGSTNIAIIDITLKVTEGVLTEQEFEEFSSDIDKKIDSAVKLELESQNLIFSQETR